MFLSSDSVIKVIVEDKETSEFCLKCGVCCIVETHHCPIQYDSKYNPTFTYVYDILSSPVDNDALWQCVSCHKCEELCPYDVSPVHFIENIKSRAFKTGKAVEGIVNEIKSVIGSGYAFPVTDYSERQREELGLQPIKLEFNELGIIAEKTGLLGLLALYEEDRE